MNALTDILAEIAQAMRPKREPDGQWNKVAEERAGNAIAMLFPKIMVMLAQRVSTDVLAEVLAEVAVDEGVETDTGLAKSHYRKWLRGMG